jgi:hypothetical protein
LIAEALRRRKEFLAFMDEIVAAYPNPRLEVFSIISIPTTRTRIGSNAVQT